MANKDNIDLVGKTIVLAVNVTDNLAVITLDDDTVITFSAQLAGDQVVGRWPVLQVDVTNDG